MLSNWQQEFVNALHRGGVEEGHTILVHSSFKALRVEGTPDDVVDALQQAVGSSGTLVVPTHSWAIVNAKQPIFDVLLTPSHVGVITERVRLRPGAVRSLHPTHSVAAIGARAIEITQAHEQDDTPCSRTSPYGRVVAWNGCIVMLGVDLTYNTTYHGVEEWAGVDWLFRPDYQEDLYTIDSDGHRIHVPSRRHSSLPRAYEVTQGLLQQEGILRAIPWRETSILVIKASPMAQVIGNKLAENPSYLLKQPVKGKGLYSVV